MAIILPQRLQRLVELSELILWSAGTCISWLEKQCRMWEQPSEVCFCQTFVEMIRLIHWATSAQRASPEETGSLAVLVSAFTNFMKFAMTGISPLDILILVASLHYLSLLATMLCKLCRWLKIYWKVSIVMVRNTENLSRAFLLPVHVMGHSLIFFR